MIAFDAEILSGNSIGNFIIGENIENYLQEVYMNFPVREERFNIPNGEVRSAYILDETLTVTTSESGVILAIGCNEKYKGFFKKSLHAGQLFIDIKERTQKQRMINGTIIVDDDFGLYFVVPSPYDELADCLDDIPLTITLNEIYVGDFSSWAG